jgi:23S rRNA pseudouridine2457 synthase
MASASFGPAIALAEVCSPATVSLDRPPPMRLSFCIAAQRHRRQDTPAPRDRGQPRVLLLNKPFGCLSSFTAPLPGQVTLADFVAVPDVYAAGRLDADSEGLLVLTNSGTLQARLASPSKGERKTYWVCVEGEATEEKLDSLRKGVLLNDGWTMPAEARLLDSARLEATLWPRTPPVRHRLTVPTSWLELQIGEGRNRQVRRMTASVQLPCLRLVRVSVGKFSILDNGAVTLSPGQWVELAPSDWEVLLG